MTTSITTKKNENHKINCVCNHCCGGFTVKLGQIWRFISKERLVVGLYRDGKHKCVMWVVSEGEENVNIDWFNRNYNVVVLLAGEYSKKCLNGIGEKSWLKEAVLIKDV